MRKEHLDTEEFWIVGDFVARVFARWGGEAHRCYHGCYVDCSDPTEAERFYAYREAQKYCCHEKDMVRWRKSQRDPKAVRPLRCRVQVVVYGPGMKP